LTRRFDALVTATRASRATQALVMAVAAVAIVVIGLTDYVTGIAVSLSVFYFIPVTAVTVAVSPAAGFGLSAIAAVAWTLADTFKIDSTPVLQVWNGLFRFCALSFVVALLAALRRALREAQASERRSKEFLANAAHQLRTPVAAVRASAEALGLTARTATPAQRERLASNLTIEAERMGRLVRSLLRLTRLDQGDPLEPGRCDVEQLVQVELDRLRVLAPHLDLRFERQARATWTFILDTSAVADIVANLLDNARRHASGRVDVTLEASTSQLRILVGDDGPGLPAGGEERAFDRFVSLDGQGGSGLGLSIARSLAIAQGGGLAYRARRFVVALPAVSDETFASTAADEPALGGQLGPVAGDGKARIA
jgi:signal transduction histidine kinase